MDFYGDEAHQSLAETQILIQQLQDAYTRREALHWGITLKSTQTFIGSCTFFFVDPGLHYVEIGYELHQAYWRQGIMTEALSAILTYGFTRLGLHRIEASMDARNAPSRSLLLMLGFTHEGILRQRFFFRDTFLDAHYFGLLKADWLKSV